MSDLSLLFGFPDLAIEHVAHNGTTLIISAHPRTHGADCPQCGQPSVRLHNRYSRSPRDLPISGQTVRLVLHVRRFFCATQTCPRRTFTERLPAIVPVHAQRTERLMYALRAVGHALGGEAGARLGRSLRLPASAATLLRIVRGGAAAPCPTPRVLGWTTLPYAKGGPMVPSWSIWNVVVRLICSPIARPTPWPRGCMPIPVSR